MRTFIYIPEGWERGVMVALLLFIAYFFWFINHIDDAECRMQMRIYTRSKKVVRRRDGTYVQYWTR